MLVEDNITNTSISIVNFIVKNPILPFEGICLGLTIPFLLIAGNHTINDYYDYTSDITNQRLDRPLVKGLITPQFAFRLAILTYVMALVITCVVVVVYRISILLIPIVIFFIFLGVFYNLGIKNYGLLGNIWVSTGYVAPFAMGALFFGFMSEWVFLNLIITSSFILFLALGREILKDIMDLEGDLATGKKSVPIVLGTKNAVWLSSIVYLISILSGSSLMFFGFRGNFVFIVGYFLVVLLISYTLVMMIKNPSPDNAIKARKYTRWTLWWSTVLIFFSSFFIL